MAKVPGLGGVSLEAEASPIFEELNLCWARHELISDGLDEVLPLVTSLPGPTRLLSLLGCIAGAPWRRKLSWAEGKNF